MIELEVPLRLEGVPQGWAEHCCALHVGYAELLSAIALLLFAAMGPCWHVARTSAWCFFTHYSAQVCPKHTYPVGVHCVTAQVWHNFLILTH